MLDQLETKELSLDPEEEFIFHLAVQESLERILRDDLASELLENPRAKSIYAWVQYRFQEDGKYPTLEMLVSEFETERFQFQEPRSSIEWVLQRLRHRYLKNEVWDLALAIGDLHDKDNPEEALQLLRAKSAEIEKKSLTGRDVWKMADYPVFIQELQDNIINGMYRGYSVGFELIDAYTGGLRPGYLAGLAARPKRMKSWLLLQSFIQQIKDGSNPVLYTLELTAEEVMLRLGCMVSGYPWDKAQKGIFESRGDWEMLEWGWKDFVKQYDNRGSVVRPPFDERSVSALVNRADKLEADSILVSQFRYITPVKEYKNPHDTHASIVFDLKRAATKHGSERPLYVETQLNREAQNVGELQELDLAQLGLTDAWGQACDVMYAIVQTADLYANSMVEFGILDARNHGKRSWYIQGEFKTSTYLDLVLD